MREAGASYGSIASELGMSKSKAYKITKDTKVGEEAVESKGYLDAEARFAQLLSDYGIKDARRVVAYASSQGDVYRDLSLLKQCLLDQGLSAGKVVPIIKHWASMEQLPVPERLAIELGPEVAPAAKQHDRWSLIGNTPIRDPDGQYSFLQALQLLQTGGADDTKSLLAGIYKKLTEGETGGLAALKDEVRQLREDRSRAEIAAVMTSVQGLRAELVAIKSEQGAKGEYDIMGQGLAVLDRRLGSIESGVMARWSIPPRPLPPGEKQALTQAIGEEAVEAQALDELAQQVFYGQPPPGPPKQIVPQPPASYE
ncbi:hypothetical protein ES703_76477 [subsurface metagenome]